jgi:polygalacturonase
MNPHRDRAGLPLKNDRPPASLLSLAACALALGCATRAAPLPPLGGVVATSAAAPSGQLPWPEANAILARIRPPVFPPRTCRVTDHGAVGDGRTDNTDAFARAIAACAAAGGGHVVVSAGTWVTGAIDLLDDIDLHLDGATLAFSDDASKFPIVLTRFEGIELMNHAPLVRAFQRKNVAITGKGILDASRTAAWNRDSGGARGQLTKWGAEGTPVPQRILAAGDSLRSTTVEPWGCQNVLIEGITIKGSRFWQIHPVLSNNVIVDGVTTSSSGSQSDGCDPESSTDVLIQNSTLVAGDDAIAIKSGRDQDGRRVGRPSENIVIRHCAFDTNWGMITVGSEESGGVRHVYGHDLRSIGQRTKFVLYVKANLGRGGYVTDVNLDQVWASHLQRAVAFITLAYQSAPASFPPRFDGFTLSRLTVDGAAQVLNLVGTPSDPIGAVHLERSTFTNIVNPQDSVLDVGLVTRTQVTVNGQAAP